jgi:hypothetical protein
VFTARYAQSSYIKQAGLVCKGLMFLRCCWLPVAYYRIQIQEDDLQFLLVSSLCKCLFIRCVYGFVVKRFLNSFLLVQVGILSLNGLYINMGKTEESSLGPASVIS